jgi:hypothetical protein
MASKLVFCVSCLTVAAAVVLTVVCGLIVADGNDCWSAFGFTMSAGFFDAVMLLFAVIPSSILFARNRQRRDLIGLLLAGCSFVAVLAQIILLNALPMRGE